RLETVLSGSVSPPLQIRELFAPQQRSFCLRHFRRCFSWAKSSVPKRHSCFSAILREPWLRPLRRAAETSSLALPGSTTRPHARRFLTQMLLRRLRRRGLTGALL